MPDRSQENVALSSETTARHTNLATVSKNFEGEWHEALGQVSNIMWHLYGLNASAP